MKDPAIKDVIEWDVRNWSRVLSFWEEKCDLNGKGYRCLELGARGGGLSLWLASKGNEVICSDLENPQPIAEPLHQAYGVRDRIAYESIDLLKIPYQESFDLIIFKSVLGGASRSGADANKQVAIENVRKALRPGGVLLFCENLAGTSFHRWLRRKFVRWGGDWNYLCHSELQDLLSKFSDISFRSYGFLGLLGRSEKMRHFLGNFDRSIDKGVPSSWRYILACYAKK